MSSKKKFTLIFMLSTRKPNRYLGWKFITFTPGFSSFYKHSLLQTLSNISVKCANE